jgi:endonuclease/exonuclease/phosphatase family metal-dependent hydrolase
MAEFLRKPERRGFWRSLPRGYASLALTAVALMGIQADIDYADEVQQVREDAGAITGDTVSVMTANVHGWRAPDGSNNLDDLLLAMSEHRVDVACLQEVDITEGQLDKLFDAGYNVVYAETERDGYGNAVISKTDIEMKQNYNLPPTDTIRQRGALLVQIATGSGEIELLATHITTRQRYQPEQFGRLGRVAHERHADIVCGDLNRELEVIAQSTLGEYFSEALASQSRAGDTYPARNPNRGIDFVLSSCEERESAQLLGTNSDHLAVKHEFVVAGCD